MTARSGVRARAIPYLGAAAAICVVTLVVYAPLISSLRTHLLTAEATDARNAVRGVWLVDRLHSTPFTLRRDPYNGAPEGVPLIPAAAAASPLQPTFQWLVSPVLGVVATFNLFLLLGVAATALAGFVFLFRLEFGFVPSLVGGCIVAFNPWSIERAAAGAPAFNHAWPLVLLLASLIRLRREPTARSLVLAGAAYATCFLVAAYFGLIGAAFLAGYLFESLVLRRSGRQIAEDAGRVTAIGTIAVLPLLPAIALFVDNRKAQAQALSNPLTEVVTRSAAPLASYLLPSPRNPLFGGVWDALGPNDPLRERILFFGYTTIGLAITSVILMRRGAFAQKQLGGLTLSLCTLPVAYVFSLPRMLHVGHVGLYTPSALIGLATSYYRVYARFGYVFGIALAVLAAGALSQISLRRHGTVIVGVLTALLVMEYLPGTLPVRAANNAPAYDVWLGNQPSGIVAHYPLPTDNELALLLEGEEYYYQRFTNQRNFALFGAGTGGTREEGVRLLARYVDRPLTLRILRAEGVRYVVVHDDIYRALHEDEPALGPPGFTQVARFPNVRIFTIHPRQNPHLIDKLVIRYAPQLAQLEGRELASVTPQKDGFLAPERYHNVLGWRWMTQSGVLRVHNPYSTPTRFRITAHAFSNSVPRTVAIETTAYHRITSFHVLPYETGLNVQPITFPPGDTTVILYASPGPQVLGATDSRFGSIYLGPARAVPLPEVSLRAG